MEILDLYRSGLSQEFPPIGHVHLYPRQTLFYGVVRQELSVSPTTWETIASFHTAHRTQSLFSPTKAA
jgi:hypothetical protein